jgi:hypothetical protein
MAAGFVSEAEGKFWTRFIRGLRQQPTLSRAATDSEHVWLPWGSLVMVDGRDPTASFVVTSGVLNEQVQRYIDQYADIDPVPARFLALPVGRAMTTHRLFTPEERVSHRVYTEFFLPIGLVETLGGPLYSSDGNFAMIALLRGDDRPVFDDRNCVSRAAHAAHYARAATAPLVLPDGFEKCRLAGDARSAASRFNVAGG